MDARHIVTPTELGPVTITAVDNEITGVYFPDEVYQPSRPRRLTTENLGRPVAKGEDELLDAAATQLDHYLAGRRTNGRLPMTIPDADGKPIQLSAWELVTRIQHRRANNRAGMPDRPAARISRV
ncbi:O6-methylguanine-DNA--protein-cysteine methyltransferase [Catenulispora sp. MAP5-51]|uniref:hypothetical protein n=1 Tax=Catenulispora sp. MAP5-51 TaxID=3156298 RepID=UPI0035149B33